MVKVRVEKAGTACLTAFHSPDKTTAMSPPSEARDRHSSGDRLPPILVMPTRKVS